MLVSAIFKWFWFWCGALWLVLIATTIRSKLAEAVRHDLITSDEAAAFLRGLAISVGLLCGILGMIAAAANLPAPPCIEPFSFDDWPSAGSNGLILIAWAALLSWVWLGSGADLLGRIAPAFTNAPKWRRRYSPVLVRIVVTLLLAGAAAGAFLGSRVAPPERSTMCAAGQPPLQPLSGVIAAG